MLKRRKVACPCCGSLSLSRPGEYELCLVCMWEDDPEQRADPTLEGGANDESLEHARFRWQQTLPPNPETVDEDDPLN